MKKINVTYACAAAEEFPGCADLLYSYSEMNVVARTTSLFGVATGMALAKSDVLVVDESVLALDGLQAVQSVHATYPRLKLLLVYEININNSMIECLSIGIRGVLERKSCISLLRRAIPALHAGDVWMPRGVIQSLRNQLAFNDGRSSWYDFSSNMPGCGKMN
ncbi:MAG: hypothetical protein PVH54_05245 [Gammaproteobacteria bacterium]|jgi:DNA-binding NarL/FixJ family response regulator